MQSHKMRKNICVFKSGRGTIRKLIIWLDWFNTTCNSFCTRLYRVEPSAVFVLVWHHHMFSAWTSQGKHNTCTNTWGKENHFAFLVYYVKLFRHSLVILSSAPLEGVSVEGWQNIWTKCFSMTRFFHRPLETWDD